MPDVRLKWHGQMLHFLTQLTSPHLKSFEKTDFTPDQHFESWSCDHLCPLSTQVGTVTLHLHIIMLRGSSGISLHCCALCRVVISIGKNDSFNFAFLLHYLMFH